MDLNYIEFQLFKIIVTKMRCGHFFIRYQKQPTWRSKVSWPFMGLGTGIVLESFWKVFWIFLAQNCDHPVSS